MAIKWSISFWNFYRTCDSFLLDWCPFCSWYFICLVFQKMNFVHLWFGLLSLIVFRLINLKLFNTNGVLLETLPSSDKFMLIYLVQYVCIWWAMSDTIDLTGNGGVVKTIVRHAKANADAPTDDLPLVDGTFFWAMVYFFTSITFTLLQSRDW